jgi:hypothetical protein
VEYPNKSWVYGTLSMPSTKLSPDREHQENIVQARKEADYFHELALQYRMAGHEALSSKAFFAEKTCRENVSALERELNESAPPKVMNDRSVQETLEFSVLTAKELSAGSCTRISTSFGVTLRSYKTNSLSQGSSARISKPGGGWCPARPAASRGVLNVRFVSGNFPLVEWCPRI